MLGAIFIDEGKLVFVREYIEPGDFFKYSHRLIFKSMIDLADRGDAIDATTVRIQTITNPSVRSLAVSRIPLLLPRSSRVPHGGSTIIRPA